MNKVAYVVLERGFEYNDEYYYGAESGGGKAKKAFLDKKLADKYAVQLNVAAFRDLVNKDNLAAYLQESPQLSGSQKKFINKLLNLPEGFTTNDYWAEGDMKMKIDKSSSDEDVMKAMKLFNLQTFFFVDEAEFSEN